GLVHYILENDLWFKDYVLHYTNIATLISEDFRDVSVLDGIFSGFNRDDGKYSPDSWQYEGKAVPSSLAEHFVNVNESYSEKTRRMRSAPPPQDPTLQHPRCVYQILRRHYAAYTPEMVERVTSCPKETFLAVCEALARNSGRDR